LESKKHKKIKSMNDMLIQTLTVLMQNGFNNSIKSTTEINGKIVDFKLRTKLSKKKKKQLKRAAKERREAAEQVDPMIIMQKQINELSASVKKLNKKSFKKK